MIDFPIIDSHIHLLDQKRFGYAWASGAPALKRDWTPDDLAAPPNPMRSKAWSSSKSTSTCRNISTRRIGSTASPDATVACSAPSSACRWSAGAAIEPEMARIAEAQDRSAACAVSSRTSRTPNMC